VLPEPLHPAVVHFPLVFALVLPILAIVALWRMHDGAPLRTWGVVVFLAVLSFGAGYLAARIGEAEEERAEEVLASEDPIHEHEEAAEMFLLVSGITAGLAILGFAPRLIGRSARLLALLGSLIAAAAIARTGFLGGELVFQHGAAAAYTAVRAEGAVRADSSVVDTTAAEGREQ
jgi:uncharacterized membrane protein